MNDTNQSFTLCSQPVRVCATPHNSTEHAFDTLTESPRDPILQQSPRKMFRDFRAFQYFCFLGLFTFAVGLLLFSFSPAGLVHPPGQHNRQAYVSSLRLLPSDGGYLASVQSRQDSTYVAFGRASTLTFGDQVRSLCLGCSSLSSVGLCSDDCPE